MKIWIIALFFLATVDASAQQRTYTVSQLQQALDGKSPQYVLKTIGNPGNAPGDIYEFGRTQRWRYHCLESQFIVVNESTHRQCRFVEVNFLDDKVLNISVTY